MDATDPGARRHPVPDLAALTARIRDLRARGSRDRDQAAFVEGVCHVIQALDAGVDVDALVWSRTLLTSDVAEMLVRRRRREGTPTAHVTPEQFRALSQTARASGIGAIVRQRWTPLARADPSAGLCWLALGRMRSPGNLGTIVRTAEATGVAGLILLGSTIDPFDPAVVRASMGGLFRLRLVRASLLGFRRWTEAHGCTVLGTSPRAAALWTDAPLERPLVIVLGDEREGLSPRELDACTALARLPMRGAADSLNIGVAAGVMLYEVLRRAGAAT